MRVLAGLHESLQAEVVALFENQLSPEEKSIVDDILGGGVNENVNSIMDKVKQYAAKGMLTASIIAALMASPSIGAAQKAQIKQMGGQAQTSQSNLPAHTLNVHPLTPAEAQEWNMFLDFVKSKGLAGSPELDHKDNNLGAKLFAEFKQANPGVSINFDIVASVQNELQQMAVNFRDFGHRHNDPQADNIGKSYSKIDGWFGSKTSTSYIPKEELIHVHNGDTVSHRDMGYMNQSGTAARPGQKVPKVPKEAVDTYTNAQGQLMWVDAAGDSHAVN